PPTVAAAAPMASSIPHSPDNAAMQRGAREFRALVDQGRVHLNAGDRDRAQIESLCANGIFLWPAPTAVPVKASAPARDAGDTLDGEPAGDLIGGDPLASRSSDHDRGIRPSAPAPRYFTEPPSTFFRMLNVLAERSSESQPLTITSLLRPPYRTAHYYMQSPTNPHALGIAVDIGAFGGHPLVTSDPESEVQAVVALLKALPPGRYRMGLPKAPDSLRPTDPSFVPADPAATEGNPTALAPAAVRVRSRTLLASRGGRQDRSAPPQPQVRVVVPTSWPFFPPPQRVTGANGKLVLAFGNEHYAPEQAINDARVRDALAEARRRGADVFAVFPDGVNHVHIDVKSAP
ncbi:MAG TPA: hypothetical protein VKT77_20135, partial [Chthonomonadaceae bacterium]|nr:hypothetical protein [Chthonomonadaceae bacterium]